MRSGSDTVRGVAVDCTNRPPTAASLSRAGLDSVRIEMRDLESFYSYTESLKARIRQVWLVGPSTGDIQPILDKSWVQPLMVIIGNEPDIQGDSSWSMPPSQYVDFYNDTASRLKTQWPDVVLATAGMRSLDYLLTVLPKLGPKPNYTNLHYPELATEIAKWTPYKPIIGEWCYRTAASKSEMANWIRIMERYCWHWFWFCWADYMVPDMGLLDSEGKPTSAYRYLKGAILETT